MTARFHAVVFLVSAAILGAEIFLMGMFCLIQWHHFAALIISVALLGFGVSGTVLALGRDRFLAHWERWFWHSVISFVVSLPAAVALLPWIPFNPFRLLWDAQPLLPLLLCYLLLLVPFTAGATVIGLAFLRPGTSIAAVYCANLLGSGVGVIVGLLLGYLPLPVPLSEYKSLSKCLLLPDATVRKQQGHPLGRMDVVAAPALRVAPGLSLAYRGHLPPQEAIFINGDGPSAVLLAPPSADSMEFLEWLPSALPYRLRTDPSVLVIGVGGGLEMLQAQRLSRSAVVGVEAHPRVAAHVSAAIRLGEAIRVGDGRGFVRAGGPGFDLIQISLLESFGTAAAGIHSTQENYLYTVEAFRDYLARLRPGGLLAITRWLQTPPRDAIRLFATAVAALEAEGGRPADQLLFARGLQAGTLVVSRAPFREADVAAARRFCEERQFDLDYFPGIRESDSLRFHLLPDNPYFHAFQQILFGDRSGFFEEYWFDVRPTTDDRPFFSQSFRWGAARPYWSLLRRQALPLGELGYLVQIATLVQAVTASMVLIGLPLLGVRWGTRRQQRREQGPRPEGRQRFTVLVYFVALGLGFLLLEMALLQKFVLFLAHPIYSAAVVIGAFLVFAGLGSATAWMRSPFAPLCGIVVVGALELVFLPPLLAPLLGAAFPVKVCLVIAAIAPLGFLMGMPFPLGLRRVSETAPVLVPWAWGINGCLSVVAAAGAPLLAVHVGFTAVIALGLGCYLAAALVCGRLDEAMPERCFRGNGAGGNFGGPARG